MRFKYDKAKSERLKKDPRRRIGFREVKEIWTHYHYVDCRSDDPEQFRAIGWVKGKLYTVIYEVREDRELNISRQAVIKAYLRQALDQHYLARQSPQ